MLFSYTYVHHSMEKMQEFIKSIFDVWCKATFGQEFSLELFEGDTEIKDILSHFGFATNAPERGRKFYQDVKYIYGLFSGLNSSAIDLLKQWYNANNDIEKVCANDPETKIAIYADIARINPDLSEALSSFFKGLYSKELLDLAELRNKIGRIDEHYKAFMQVNSIDICPFCGLSHLKGVHHTKREAYDHFLPKASYPFNSINFHNLAPACNECNSSYKLGKDPVHNATGRRKAFYPYASVNPNIEIHIDLNHSDIDNLNPEDIRLTFEPDAVRDEIDTWREIYGIDERFRAKCCGADAKAWLEEVRILQDIYNIEPAVSLSIVQKQAEHDPVANINFLKKAFLNGCNRVGLLSLI